MIGSFGRVGVCIYVQIMSGNKLFSIFESFSCSMSFRREIIAKTIKVGTFQPF